MKSQHWWKPGMEGGLVSRAWAQVFIFPLPKLKRSELATSLQYKVQALLPSSEFPLITHFAQHEGKLYGVAILDRIPEPKPPLKNLMVGVPLILPKSWPSDCLLAVATEEDWEVHRFRNHILNASYPPIQSDSAVASRILDQNPDVPAYWIAPTPKLDLQAPKWAVTAPAWPDSHAWGISLSPPKEPRWPWLLAGFFILGGVFLMANTGIMILQDKKERNREWEAWLNTARTQIGTPDIQKQSNIQGEAQSGEPLKKVLTTLSTAWPSGVEIRRLELLNGKLTLTAKAASALSAMASLSTSPLGKQLRVIQIRPTVGGEEFDLEGKATP
jgi:hypothetical protein